MKKIIFLIVILLGINTVCCASGFNKNDGMIVRISEVEVYPEYLNEYLLYARSVAEASVEKEKGVISIYPMMKISDNNQIRILEIYKNEDAYKKHIASEHFKTYKTGTLHMVKSLDLVDMYQIAPQTFNRIFSKK